VISSLEMMITPPCRSCILSRLAIITSRSNMLLYSQVLLPMMIPALIHKEEAKMMFFWLEALKVYVMDAEGIMFFTFG